MLSANINLICFRKAFFPPLEQREWHVIDSSFCEPLNSGLETLESGQVSQFPST